MTWFNMAYSCLLLVMLWMMMHVNLNPVHYQIDPHFDTMEQVGKYWSCDLFVSLLQRPHLNSVPTPSVWE